MAIIQCATDSFKNELVQVIHDFTNDTFRIALYTNDASIGPGTTAYTTSGEVSGAGYSAGGIVLNNIVISNGGGVTYITWDNPTWPNAFFVARGALIYNISKADRSVVVYDFGTDVEINANANTIKFPPNTATSAILRLGSPR